MMQMHDVTMQKHCFASRQSVLLTKNNVRQVTYTQYTGNTATETFYRSRKRYSRNQVFLLCNVTCLISQYNQFKDAAHKIVTCKHVNLGTFSISNIFNFNNFNHSVQSHLCKRYKLAVILQVCTLCALSGKLYNVWLVAIFLIQILKKMCVLLQSKPVTYSYIQYKKKHQA